MRRWLTAMALGGVMAVALAGCGTPGGVDGVLTDDWAALGEPKPFLPAAKICHQRWDDTGYVSVYNPSDCAASHVLETVHVGTFTAEHAARATPPPAGSPAARAAYAECDKKATEFVGAEWRGTRLELSVVIASEHAWSGGGRWFRCDLGEMDNLDDGARVTRTSSLAGAAAGASPLAYGCFEPKIVKDRVERMEPIGCDKPHHSEYVGIYTAPDITWESLVKDSDRTHKGCLDVVASYAKVPRNTAKYRAGTIIYPPNEQAWSAGNRGVQCFLWRSAPLLTRSVQGGGDKVLPLR
ncbi:septum formation family protein [Micromonospora sp. NPDC049679]|uniref:septum formation family protein n=1 Tax=Micromonospora sp. NPDC049679 TaxID=3155920 RepID=UPI0033FC2FB3